MLLKGIVCFFICSPASCHAHELNTPGGNIWTTACLYFSLTDFFFIVGVGFKIISFSCEESELFVRTYLRACGLGLTNIFQTTQQKDKLGWGGKKSLLHDLKTLAEALVNERDSVLSEVL